MKLVSHSKGLESKFVMSEIVIHLALSSCSLDFSINNEAISSVWSLSCFTCSLPCALYFFEVQRNCCFYLNKNTTNSTLLTAVLYQYLGSLFTVPTFCWTPYCGALHTSLVANLVKWQDWVDQIYVWAPHGFLLFMPWENEPSSL